MSKIKEASGARITAAALEKENYFSILDFGARESCEDAPCCLENTRAINLAIEEAAKKGGTVVIPAGEFKVYTIRLKSNVNLYLSEGSVLRAARTDIVDSYEKQIGEGGNYDEPEVNRYAGLQDHGHSYFANSMFYGADLENIMIFGKGCIDGSCYDEETGYRRYVLMGGDPWDGKDRDRRGHRGTWFGNKAIALVRCQHVVLKDFSLVIGGHFAIIAEGVKDFLVEDLLVDTTRDAFDVDCCQDVTIRRSVFNSLTDDALVMKSSYGAGIFMPTRNVLIEDCTVSGYDAGSVYAGKYTREKLIAEDRCGPTGRVKFGTEATCGYDQVTIRRVKFDRSRGFAMEAVDGSDLSNVIFTDCVLEDVSSSPLFIKVGDRGRFPVTGMQTGEEIQAALPNVRLDNRGWVLPDTEDYQKYPARRYVPSYKKDRQVTVDGHSYFSVIDDKAPVCLNEANLTRKGNAVYGKVYREGEGYVTDYSRPLSKEEILCRGNGVGAERLARVYNIEISNITIKNADPRYPILFMGLVDSPIENVVLKNITAEFRGGLSMEHAEEQRQLNTNWEYAQFETAPSIQTLPWLVNTFFLKEEGLLPRADWDEKTQSWKKDPYNVPELAHIYPEPSNWGILPAYGFYARHIRGLTVENLKLTYLVEDSRHAIVLDDAESVVMKEIEAMTAPGQSTAALVTNTFKRHTGCEYLPGSPYFTTTVSAVELPAKMTMELVRVAAPAPGTPCDEYYPYPTLAVEENGYHFAVPTEDYPLPKTVFRPFFRMETEYSGRPGEELVIPVSFRNPASETSSMENAGMVYNEARKKTDFVVTRPETPVHFYLTGLPETAVFDTELMEISWTPETNGVWNVTLTADDGLIPVSVSFTVRVIRPVTCIVRKIGADQAQKAAQIEKCCFLPAEAAGLKDFQERFASPAFSCYGAFDEKGEMIGFINGAVYDKPDLPDALYHDTSLFVEDGAWQTVFGLNVLPQYRRQGIAGQLIRCFADQAKAAGKSGMVLTCKDIYRPLYEKAGFVWQGVSASTHGGASWNDMKLIF